MDFRAEVTTRMIHDPRQGFEATASAVETRWDPLSGRTARLLRDVEPLLPAADFDVAELAARTRPGCPFCPDRIEAATPRFVGAGFDDGRIRVGRAVLFPNLLPYAAYSSVCVYAPERHDLPLAQMMPSLAADNLRAQVVFIGAAQRENPAAAAWASINGNHLLPAGSSVFHPHTQGGCHPVPTNAQAQLVAVPPELAEEYLTHERRSGQRYIASTGRIDWVASFAPAGPGEIRGFSRGVGRLAGLDDDVVVELAAGITHSMHTYAGLGISSCNLAVYGAPLQTAGCRLLARLVCRSPLAPFYRSDVTYLERLHAETATDITPEDLAARAQRHFAASNGLS